MTREQALVAAAEKFIAKVESGRARSRETYAELKAALAIQPDSRSDVHVYGCPMDGEPLIGNCDDCRRARAM